MKDLIENYIGEIITALAGLGAWAFERKKRKVDIAKSETQNQQQVVDLYQEALDDLKKRYDEKFAELETEIKLLRNNLDLWKGKYRMLKKEFDVYKKKHQ